MLDHCSGFKTNAFYWVLKSCEAVGNILNFAGQFSLEAYLAFVIDDAHRTRPNRHI
jgi:hypothetical protein